MHARADVEERRHKPVNADIAVSARTGEGVDQLMRLLVERARTLLPREGEIALSRRQRDLLALCHAQLVEADEERDPLLLAEALRSALAALDRLTGRAGTEQMLDALFGRFCIGK